MKVLLVCLPVIFLVILAGCAARTCRNDACYNRKVASVDPYKKGEIAAWGTEKEAAKKEEEEEVKINRQILREQQ